MIDEKHWHKADRIIERAAEKIAAELDRMSAGLPHDVSEQYALDRLVQRLLTLRPSMMQRWIKHGWITERSFMNERLACLPLGVLLEERRRGRAS